MSSFPDDNNQLVATGDREIIEGNNWGDKEWGCVWNGKEWIGENKLGRALMQIRDEITKAAFPVTHIL